MSQNDLIPINGWTVSIAGLVSPAFHTLQGLSKKTGTMTVIDAGSNQALNFSDGIEECGPITLIRTRDGSADDKTFGNLINNAIQKGTKFNGSFTQYRFGKVVMKLLFTGMLANDYSLSDFKTDGKGDSAKSDQKLVAAVDHWEEA